MPLDRPGPIVVRTVEGAQVTLPSAAALERWVSRGLLGPNDRVRGGDGRWQPISRAFAGPAGLDGPVDVDRWPDAPAGLRSSRLAVHRRRTLDLKAPSVTNSAPVSLGS